MVFYDDNFLVWQCLNGRKDAFEKLVDKYQKVILNVSYRMTGNLDDAEDITQSVFLKAFSNLNLFNAEHKFFSWLYRITVNECLNHLKPKKRIEKLEHDVISEEKSPEDLYAENELSAQIQAALMKLSPDYRSAVILRHYRHCSYEEMGDILNIPVKTVKSRLFTARQLLKEILIKEKRLK